MLKSGCLVGIFCLAAAPGWGSTITAIPQPTLAYTSETALINISGIANGTSGITSISGGGETVTFDGAVTKTTVGVGWSSWNCPPATESCTPPILTTVSQGETELTMTLSSPVFVFGFEAEPDLFAVDSMTATFFNGATNLGSINLGVNGNGGALLFAASSTTPITSVQFVDLAVDTFAIANVRFGTIPEPSSMLLVGTALAGLAGLKRKLQRK